ncbi:hypothetical protein [Actinokineospora sp. HUAS TT18]|uniref:hypothetical protein n=1 Tax=Actinokineospora sp. HUAS TT18 TaxID=3447451 RepID=UPI003F5246ED
MTRLLIGLFLTALIVLGGGSAATATPFAQQTETVAPTGPTLDPATNNDAATSKKKLVIGVTAAVLLGIVIYGNRVRAKRRKAG